MKSEQGNDDLRNDEIFQKQLLDKNTKLQEIIVALCDYDGRCTVCYRYISTKDKTNCGGCEEYYCECNCTPLTPMQIINGED